MNYDSINEAIVILRTWGMTRLIKPELKEYLAMLENDFSRILEKGVNQDEIIAAALNETCQSVISARNILKNKNLITVVEGDDIWHMAENALADFDRIVFLKEAILYFVKQNAVLNHGEAISKLDSALEEVIAWLENSDWSPLRLTALNELRRNYMERIPSDKRRSFPWYGIFADYDTETIDILIQNYDCLIDDKKWDKFPESIQNRMPAIFYEIYKDNELADVIKSEYAFNKSLLEAAAKRSALSLWWISEENAINYPVDNIVAKAGLVRTAINLFKKVAIGSIKKDQIEKIYWIFLIAFCGPDLSNAQRMELFDIVEKKIGDIDIKKVSGEKREVLSILKDWFDNKNIRDEVLAETAFSKWNNLLLYSIPYYVIFLPDGYDKSPEEFWKVVKDFISEETLEKVSSLQISEPEVAYPLGYEESIFEKTLKYISGKGEIVLSYLKDCIAPDDSLELIPIRRSGSVSETRQFTLQINPMLIKCKSDDKGIYHLLPFPNDLMPGFADKKYNEEYRRFSTDFLNNSQMFSCGMYFVSNKGEITEGELIDFTVDKEIGKIKEVKGANYEKAVIAISSNKDVIKAFVDKINEMKKLTEEDKADELRKLLADSNKFNNIALIICIFE